MHKAIPDTETWEEKNIKRQGKTVSVNSEVREIKKKKDVCTFTGWITEEGI
jgi:hypothetical protein